LTPLLIFIVGPTCIGKSTLAIKLAKKFEGEIVNADSMQVYSNLKILTARPTKQDLKFVKHHLYGYIDGSIRYNVASWCKDASEIINNNHNNYTTSIVVGGTGMYVDKILNGLVQIPKIPEKVKKISESLLLEQGIDKFVNTIKKFDEESLNRISMNDTSRLRRIWEVYQHTNQTLTYWLKSKNNNYLKNNKYIICLFTPNRKEIYKRVDERFLKMIKDGAINEVKKLNSLNLDRSLPIMRAHGVPEITNYLSNLATLEECINKGQQLTRNYVKRQLTWWRSTKLQIHECFDQFPGEIDINSLNF